MLRRPALERGQAQLSHCWVQAKGWGRQRPLVKERRQLWVPRGRGQGRAPPLGMVLEQARLRGQETPQGLARQWRWGGPGVCAAARRCRRRRRRQLQAAAGRAGVVTFVKCAGGVLSRCKVWSGRTRPTHWLTRSQNSAQRQEERHQHS